MTTTRWKVVIQNEGGSGEVVAIATDRIDHPVQIATVAGVVFANQIVREHNAHAAMVEALESIRREISVMSKRSTGAWSKARIKADLEGLSEQAQAAMRLAKGDE